MDKKQEQLGMNPSTANNRLIKDLLFKFAVDGGHTCFQCGKPLTRDTFSIEHKVPWLDSDNPRELFFSLDNIAYSHLSCNIKEKRSSPTRNKKYTHGESGYRVGCRCEICKVGAAAKKKERYKAKKAKAASSAKHT